MPSATLGGGGTRFERFQQMIIDKFTGGTSAVLLGHLLDSEKVQGIVARGTIFHRSGQRFAVAGDTAAGEPHVAGS